MGVRDAKQKSRNFGAFHCDPRSAVSARQQQSPVVRMGRDLAGPPVSRRGLLVAYVYGAQETAADVSGYVSRAFWDLLLSFFLRYPALGVDDDAVAVDPDDGNEGIMAFTDPSSGVMMPMIGADCARVESLKIIADEFKEKAGIDYRLKYYELVQPH